METKQPQADTDSVKRIKRYTLGILVAGLVLYLGFRLGNLHYQQQLQDIASLKQTLANIDKENNRLTLDMNLLGVELEVQKLAAQNAQDAIEQGLSREAELRKQLGFYQKVMAPELKEKGFVIDAFDIEQTLSDRVYRFDLVLMQQEKIKHTLKGNLDVRIKGSEQGQPKTLRLRDLMSEDIGPLVFGFKYFQVIHGEFTLPERFQPEKIEVRAEVFQFKKKRGDLERTFDWQVAPSSALTGENI